MVEYIFVVVFFLYQRKATIILNAAQTTDHECVKSLKVQRMHITYIFGLDLFQIINNNNGHINGQSGFQ